MKFQLIINILIFFLLVSCTEKFDISLVDGATNSLVVEGSITSEYKIHKVKLSRTSEYFINEPAHPELEAIVSLTDGDTVINLIDTMNSGIYQTEKEIAGKPGKTYSLNIKLSNGELYSASDFMKPIFPMDSINYEYGKSGLPFDEDYYYKINIFVQDPPSKGEYYQWELFLDDKHVTDTLRLKTFVSDEMVNGSYVGNWTVYQLLEYKIEKDTVSARLQMLSISKAKYEYYNAILLETDFGGSGFSGPPSNVPSNISNGALGFFSASAVSEIETTIYRVNINSKSTNKAGSDNSLIKDKSKIPFRTP